MEETQIKGHGRRTYPYRAVDRDRQTPEFHIYERRTLLPRFFKLVIGANSAPERDVIDQRRATAFQIFAEHAAYLCP